MVKSVYDYVGDQWKKPDVSFKSPQQQRLIQWRQQENFLKVEKPLRIDRARALGYKAKQGYIIVRARVRRGGLRKPDIRGGRKPSARGINKITAKKSTQRIAEERTAKRFPNMEVLNSYWIGDDGKYHYYEVILVDPFRPSIVNDPKINWITNVSTKRRVLRGKTSAGKKGRGLRHKGKGAEKLRPSVKANRKRRKKT
ncbi:MAG: 50S ribosomal protein L15e [Candidatus Thermoplasmatota archaeon]|jgi:large subunit ribosomal protein L15e|nr:50S ribosomal protein L15e [Candidatus Thermoplasmatota archaeon]